MRRHLFASFCALAALAGCNPDNMEPNPARNPINHPLPTSTLTATSDTVPALADALIRTSSRHSNHGGAQTMMVKITQSQDDSTRVVISFDQAAIAAAIGSGTLTRATLELGIEQSGTESENRLDAHRLVMPWTESGVTCRCGTDLNLANASADCPATKWRMSGPDMDAFVATRTDRAHLNPGETGVAKFNVTADVQAFLGGSANHGWLVMAANATSRAVVWSRETAVKPRLVLSIQEEESVPEQAPSTLPSWVYAATNLDSNTVALPGAFLKNIVIVEFKPSATLSQRQAAVASVNGAVVGGVPGSASEGHYYLSVPDSNRGEGLIAAVRKLESLPQVQLATYEFDVIPAFRLPRENATWSSWHTDRKTLNSENWALEAVLAPLAWGCSTGDGSLRVALVDGGFPALAADHDLAITVHPAPGGGNPYQRDHGVRVGSILAAGGNNQKGMTGMMWSADLHGYDVGGIADREHAFVGRVLQQVKNAADDGARIINLSLWVPPHWPDSTLALASRGLDATLSSLGSRGKRPLLVIAAGNGKRNASTAGYPRVAAGPNADQVIVVAASTKDSVLWVNNQEASKGSNYGELVTVAAPGARVYFTTETGAISADDGTSAAAPIVSGIAGLLLSFDSRLQAADLKSLIVEGASIGNWKATRGAGEQYDIVNAYESLKLAAQRRGAPLCGNRIWANTGLVYANRSNGAEELFAHDGDDRGVFALAARHGGREIDMLVWSAPERTFKLSASGGWFRSSEPTQLFANQSGVANSLWGLSHDGDKEAFIDFNAFDSSRILRMMLFSNGTTTNTAPDMVLPQLQAYPDTIAGIGRGTNDEYFLPWSVAFSPTGDHAVVAVSVHRTTATFNGSEKPCPWSVPDPETGAPSAKCFDSITREIQPVKADLWDYPLPRGEPRHIATLPNTVVNSVAVSEDGSTMIVNEGMKYEKFDALPSGPEGCSPTQPGIYGYCVEANRTESNATCSVTYRSLSTGVVIEPRIPALYACELPVGAMAAVKANGGMKSRSLRRP